MPSVLYSEVSNEREISLRAQEDMRLVEEALAGSAKAYEGLMRKYRKSVYHLTLKMVRDTDDAEDLTLEIFAKAFRALPKYQTMFAFSTWLFRIATNHTIDFVRRNRLRTQSLSAGIALGEGESIALDVASLDLDPQQAYMRQQRIELVQELVEMLPPKYMALIRLRYFNELSYDEIAQQMGAPLGTVKAQLHRARELLSMFAKGSKAAI
ncbi:RNA polymerase sigma factor [Hymenobacter canadensis]|uniref:Sigma-70 family RNA polymerase sigma factor n=1 Tax=Hymenobacter canadensis TaxID=2999067 RepID=A0ABY7LUL9_9BACT|nr:sigma-70 family RNA polymerase sigma factor [Hymenobacter canadensis]WBA44091.1 sigma-70 family RNA polymerase sigma factor [Hymenobacter canadensis]